VDRAARAAVLNLLTTGGAIPAQLGSARLLVASGKRNAEIAADLVVSTRTADHHVSAILPS
jgi:FixJ family two-component response regulator